MKKKARSESQPTGISIRVHVIGGAVDSFAITDEAEAERIWQSIEPSRLFLQPRLVLAGEYSKSVYVCSQILRLDFMQTTHECWQFPGGYSDVVELSEKEFKKHARLGEPERMTKRINPTPIGDPLVSFLKLSMTGGSSIFLMTEFAVKLPAESQAMMQFLLSKGGFHMRLRRGGIGLINLANMVSFTAFPGVAQVPADSWFAEPVLNEIPEEP